MSSDEVQEKVRRIRRILDNHRAGSWSLVHTADKLDGTVDGIQGAGEDWLKQLKEQVGILHKIHAAAEKEGKDIVDLEERLEVYIDVLDKYADHRNAALHNIEKLLQNPQTAG